MAGVSCVQPGHIVDFGRIVGAEPAGLELPSEALALGSEFSPEEWRNQQETFESYVAKQKNIELEEKKLAKK